MTTTWSLASGPTSVGFGDASSLTTTVSFPQPGVYTLRLTASDSEFNPHSDVVVTVIPVNQPPTVDAGPDQTISMPASANLSGTASDDGLPNPPGTITIKWSQASGPGTATFGNADALATTVSFSQSGVYKLRLTANDGVLISSDEVKIIVNGENHAPQVNAGPSQTIPLSLPASLNGSATDDGLPDPPGI